MQFPSNRSRTHLWYQGHRLLLLGGGILGGCFLTRHLAALPTPLREIKAYVSKIDDMEATVKVTQLDAKELEKIGRDFSNSYRVRNLTLQYKQPDKLRIEGKSPTLGTALLILNGSTRFYTIPKLRLRKTENLTNSPGKRQSLLEYSGLLSPDTLNFMQGQFLRTEMLQEVSTEVYELKYRGEENGSYFRIWVDPAKAMVCKRDWYDGDNRLRATFRYLAPQEVRANVWVPTRLEVRNGEDVLAATTEVSDIKLNQGLADTVFTVDASKP